MKLFPVFWLIDMLRYVLSGISTVTLGLVGTPQFPNIVSADEIDYRG